MENDQNERNRPVQNHESRNPSPSILEFPYSNSNKDVQIEVHIAQGSHYYRMKCPSPGEQDPPRTLPKHIERYSNVTQCYIRQRSPDAG